MSTSYLSIRHTSLDAQGLEALYREQLGLIYHYVYRKVGNRQEAEDLTSSILLKALRLLQQDAGPEKLSYWLVRVARTTIIDYWRANARVTHSLLEALQAASWEGSAERDPFGLDGRPSGRPVGGNGQESQQARGTARGGGAEAIFMLLPETEVSGRLKHTDKGGNR